MSVFCDAKSFVFRFLYLFILHLFNSSFYIHSSVKNRTISFRICFIWAAEITENYFQKLHTNTCKNPFWSTVKTALNCLFLITGIKLLKLLSVVCEFGSQTYVCKNYKQNICSVAVMFGGSAFWPETRVSIKISTHPC